MESPDTVTEAIALLRQAGYSADFVVDEGHLRADGGSRRCPVDEAVVEHLYRFEGPSDPGDEMVVLGLSDPVSGLRGVLASGFGPSADPAVVDSLSGLTSRHLPVASTREFHTGPGRVTPALGYEAARAAMDRAGVGGAQDLGHFREDYTVSELRRSDLAADPVDQFGRWWKEWSADPRYDAAACILATASASGRPTARYVLCRGFGPDGFELFTNLESRKASDLADNPYGSLVFGWLELNRQVRVEGLVELLDEATNDAYWETRPLGSRIGALASAQSHVIADREELEQRVEEIRARLGLAGSNDQDTDDVVVPRPFNWGGYRLIPDRVEFWQGRPDRLHDRFEYRRHDGTWTISRLAP